jgi:glycosyltransferase involved in cell wall biosynthesis
MRLLLDLQACQASSMNRGIGRYSLALAQAIVRNSGAHDVHIVLNNGFPEAAAALRKSFGAVLPITHIHSFSTPLPVAEGNPDNRWRVQAAERIREHYMASLRPDVLHVASLFEGFGDNAVNSLLHGDGGFDTAVTLYDLIPLLLKERYLTDPNLATWYHRKLDSLKNADLLVAISANARMEAIDALGVAPDRVVNISSAVDSIFVPRTLSPDTRADLMARHGLHRPFIMYTGGIDYRKNIEGLIEAYAALPGAMRRQYQLAIVCSIRDPDRVRLQRLATKLRLADGDLVLTGYVTDDDLVSLYNCTALFVFPSLHEGFGLPVLEAMACGAPVIGANTSSIPEVIGRPDAMFDPSSVPAIAAAMARVLGDDQFADALRVHGVAQAKLFSWDASARRAIAAFEETHTRNAATRRTSVAPGAAVPAPARKPRLAYVSPLPPARSGIADYSAGLLPELAKFYDIALIVAQGTLALPWTHELFPQRSPDWFVAHAHEFDRIVYQFGNSTFHVHMFDLLARFPGVVVLHDFFLSGARDNAERTSTLPNYYCRSLYLDHGYRALVEEREQRRAASCQAYPCNKSVLDRAMGVIVHSNHALALAREWYGPTAPRDWRVVPLLYNMTSVDDRQATREGHGIADNAFLMCSFGMLAVTKCVDAIVDAWLASAAGADPRCYLVFVGAVADDAFGEALLTRIAPHPRVRITGYASPALYRSFLAAADAAVQLRSNSRGETSGALQDCLHHGLPTIVNAHGAAAEVPATACVLLDDAFTIAALRDAIDTLHTDPALRQCLAMAARTAMQSHQPAKVGALMQDAIETFMRDGTGAAEQRLVQALVAIAPATTVPEGERVQVAAAIAANRLLPRAQQLLVDVTHLGAGAVSDEPLHTLIRDLVAAAPAKWRIEPVVHDGKRYRYARRFTLNLLGRTDLLIEDAVAEAGAGDILLGTDPTTPSPMPAAWLARGVAVMPLTTSDSAALLAQLVAHASTT